MRDFTKAKRIVIKIGTNTLTHNNALDGDYIQRIAAQVKAILDTGKQVVLVSSGAIAMGASRLALLETPREIEMREGCAAIGQTLLMT